MLNFFVISGSQDKTDKELDSENSHLLIKNIDFELDEALCLEDEPETIRRLSNSQDSERFLSFLINGVGNHSNTDEHDSNSESPIVECKCINLIFPV